MSEQDLATGLAALEDDEVRAKVAAGDVGAAGELELTEEERALLQAAASDEAEVVGFGINTSLAGLGGIEVNKFKWNKIQPDPLLNKANVAHKDLGTFGG